MSKTQSLFPAPYTRGQLGVATTAPRLYHVILATLFVVMPVVHMITFYFGIPVDWGFIAIWIIAGVFISWADGYGRIFGGVLAMDILLIITSLSGFPGMLSQLTAAVLPYTLGFGFFLIIRNISLFTVIPRLRIIQDLDYLQIMTTWLFRGAVLVLIASFLYITAQGITIFSSARFFSERWLHPNNISIYAGLAMMLAVLCKHIKIPFRVFGFSIGLYCLIVSQSRGVLVTVIMTFMILFFLNSSKQFVKNMVIAVIASVIIGLLIPVAAPWILELGQVKSMMDRTFNVEDPTSGRIQIIEYAVNYWRSTDFTWLFGYGWKGAFKVDNAIVAYGLEAGLVGLVIYYIFTLSTLIKSFIEFYTNKNPKIQLLAKYCIIFTFYILIRSLVERSHAFQLSDLVSNSWMLLVGFLYAQTATLDLSKLKRDKWFEHLSTRPTLSGLKPGQKPKEQPPKPKG